MQADPFAKHEVLHTASIIQSMFEDHVVEHAFVQANPALRAAAEATNEALAAFYQQVGTIVLGPSEHDSR